MWDKMETPAIVYDLDTSGGIMEQIQTLLAPPKSEEGEKRSRRPDKDARRSGRATNHDTCDSCREGGDLLCCDHCPAAFHLQCCNPPLSEEMLPPGDWMCHRCMVRRKKREHKEQINGLLERQLTKPQQSSSPVTELELGALRPDEGAGTAGLRAAVAQVRLLERQTSSRPGTPTSNASTDTPTPSEQNENEDEDLLDVEDEAPGSEPESATRHLTRPFELLIAAAMERNPTQFQLPSDLTCTNALPGTSKRRRKEETIGKNVKRPQHELDPNGLVPLPVKVCFSCSRSCRLAPLIQCDYCPLLFHMDCLEPPLTAMPVGKWMCPNHIEHIVLNRRNLTLSNRCQLFDQFQDRMSQHAVKVDFLQRVHRQNPLIRRGARAHRINRLKVPDAIKSQYQCPPAMMAPAGIRNGELICSGVTDPPQQRPPPQHLTTDAEQQEWLCDVIALQCSIVKHLSAKRMPASYWGSEPTEKVDIKPCMAAPENSVLCSPDRTVLPEPFPSPCIGHLKGPSEERRGCGSCVERPCQNCGTANGPATRGGSPEPPHARLQAELQHRLSLSGPQGPCWPRAQAMPASAPRLANHTSGAMLKTETIGLVPCTNAKAGSDLGLPAQPHRTSAGTAGGQAAALTSRSVSSPAAGTRALTPPRAPHDAATSRRGCPTPPSDGKVILRAVSPGSGSVSSAMGDLSPCLKALIEGEGEIELSKLDEKFIKLLAWQRIQQLFPPKALPTPIHRVSPPPSTTTSTPQALHTEAQQKEVQARAVFYPLMGKGVAVNMCYRSLYIGSGADMDVCLTDFGHCNYVSGKHACIFYDENTKHYELLNYSEHGTTVDNVLYSCDFSEKTSPAPYSSMVSRVQSIIRRCKKRKQQEAGAETGTGTGTSPAGGLMSCQSQGSSPKSPCGCKASSSSLVGGSGAGWEGTALLHHGSYVKLGCLQFVFSVTEFAGKQPKEEATPISVQDAAELSEKRPSLNVHQVPVLRSGSVP